MDRERKYCAPLAIHWARRAKCHLRARAPGTRLRLIHHAHSWRDKKSAIGAQFWQDVTRCNSQFHLHEERDTASAPHRSNEYDRRRQPSGPRHCMHKVLCASRGIQFNLQSGTYCQRVTHHVPSSTLTTPSSSSEFLLSRRQISKASDTFDSTSASTNEFSDGRENRRALAVRTSLVDDLPLEV